MIAGHGRACPGAVRRCRRGTACHEITPPGLGSSGGRLPFTGVSGKARAQVKVFSGLGHDTGFTRWLGGVTLTGQIEGGIMANPARPQPGYNFGDFFADHANQVR